MGSKAAFLFITLLVLPLHLSSAAPDLPVIHIISAVGPGSPPVIINEFGPLIPLRPGQDYQAQLKVKGVHQVSATYGLLFTAFVSYDPARDGGRAAVYWRADGWGFSISYDNVNFKKVEPWQSE